MKLYIDVETYSSEELKKCGSYKYFESPDFEILMIAFAIDDQPVQIIDLAVGEERPGFWMMLQDPDIEKHAHNANFERNAFKQIGLDIPAWQWHCSSVKAAYCGLPLSLVQVSGVLNLGEKGKLNTGTGLIKYFCIPCKPTKVNSQRQRNFWHHDLEKWDQFKKYCMNDVEAERQIDKKLFRYSMPDFERQYYILDQKINDKGILIDIPLVKNAMAIDEIFKEEITGRLKDLTGVDNPNSTAQLKTWLNEDSEEEITTLNKDFVTAMLGQDLPEDIAEVLAGRLMLAKSSVKKYGTMLKYACSDKRARGIHQYYGANRTGRWAGRGIQPQNLKKNEMSDLALARELVLDGDYGILAMFYDNIPNVLSELIRTAIVASEGNTLQVCDFSAIEARVLAWLAGEDWRIGIFNSHGKIYEASAAMMFGVPIEAITKGSPLRQQGKVAELALGYQGSVGALDKMDKDKKIPENERKPIVKKWREANPNIVNFWYDVEEAAIKAIKQRKIVVLRNLVFDYDGNYLKIMLPSSRQLFYYAPRLQPNKFNKEAIRYQGLDDKKQWNWVDTYGGKLVENIVQAVSRDLLAYTMQELDESGFNIVMHVHDEVVCEQPKAQSKKSLAFMNEIMSAGPIWAEGLPLKADGYCTDFYKKD